MLLNTQLDVLLQKLLQGWKRRWFALSIKTQRAKQCWNIDLFAVPRQHCNNDGLRLAIERSKPESLQGNLEPHGHALDDDLSAVEPWTRAYGFGL